MFLRVLNGVPADIGRSINLADRADVFVGVGPSAHLQVSDPAWPQLGRLRIEIQGGVFRLTNEMGHTIRLGGQDLGDGHEQVWYDGTVLQATQNTYLMLSPATGPAPAEAGSPLLAWMSLVAVVAVFLWLVAPDDEPGLRVQSADEARQEYRLVVEELRELTPAPNGRTAVAVLADVQEGRFAEVRNQPNDAYRAYLSARTTLDRVPTGQADQPALERSRAFVNARMTALAPRVKLRK